MFGYVSDLVDAVEGAVLVEIVGVRVIVIAVVVDLEIVPVAGVRERPFLAETPVIVMRGDLTAADLTSQ